MKFIYGYIIAVINSENKRVKRNSQSTNNIIVFLFICVVLLLYLINALYMYYFLHTKMIKIKNIY